ncbi:hypothetical protein [Frankia sp. AgB32]|uniref:hypothetical protein n=1 Tax=Frankia sp. AgB32 TaxID=631119 RepID=UPI00200F7B12|nr:hypothetical protein [Frankia sp. AgB32]MCK9895199.1 hypothetical protein [Frankia sp. AgB32]
MGLLSWLKPSATNTNPKQTKPTPARTSSTTKKKPTPARTSSTAKTTGTRRPGATAHVPAAVRRRVIAQITATCPYLDADDLHIGTDGGVYLLTGRPGGHRRVGTRIGDWSAPAAPPGRGGGGGPPPTRTRSMGHTLSVV